MPYLGYTIIGFTILAVLIAAWGKQKVRDYPYLLYAISASMVLLTTFAGPHLVGSDIHLEYYFAQLYGGKDVLQPIVSIPQGTSIANNIIAPFLPIPTIWVYKLVYPLLFAVVPVFLYHVYKRWLTPTQSFLASFFLIAFPSFFIEIPTIARQMTAEFVLAVLLVLLFRNSWKYRWVGVGVCASLLPLLHYSTALIAAATLSASFLATLVRRRGNRAVLGVAVLAVLVASATYLPLAEDGAVVKVMVHRWNSLVPRTLEIDYPLPPELRPVETRPRVYMDEEIRTGTGGTVKSGIPILNAFETTMRSGIGIDFFLVPTSAKIFRILHWGIGALLVVGAWRFRRNRSYWTFAAGGGVLLALMVIPGVTGILNITRFAHLALIWLAPLLAMSMRPKLVGLVLVVYFVFTSGLVFEVTRQTDLESVTIPYNVGLSDHRLDLGADTTSDDLIVSRYIVDNELFPIYSDINGANLMGELVGFHGDINRALQNVDVWPTGYVFVRSRNVADGSLTTWNGPGCREFFDPKEFGVNFNENIIYQSGNARVLEVPRGDSSVIVIPDVQGMIDNPDWYYYLEDMFEWIVDNEDTYNIEAVLQVGDVTNYGYQGDTTKALEEWARADALFDSLDTAGIKYLVVPGNHDYEFTPPLSGYPDLSDRILTHYNTNFGPTRFAGDDWWEGDNTGNSVISFDMGGTPFMAVGLQFGPTDADLAWASSIINSNPERSFFIVTHAYMNNNNTRMLGNVAHGVDNYFADGSANDEVDMWNALVSLYSQIAMVYSGHVYTVKEGVAQRTDYVGGKPVHQILTDYQGYADGGSGYFRMYSFSQTEVWVRTYSPTLNKYLTTSLHEFVLEVK